MYVPSNGTDLRDSLETIDHSSGDVAYLRIRAHAEDKPESSESHVPHRPILDIEFQSIYDCIKKTPQYRSSGNYHVAESKFSGTPNLVEIGAGVYATDTITTPPTLSVENDIHYCLDQLLGMPV